MSKEAEKIETYLKSNSELKLGLSSDLISKVTKGLGPSIYKADAEKVSCSDSSELDRIRENFLKKKLGVTLSDEELDAAIKDVCESMGSSNRNKYRVLFYALLTKNFNKESAYA